MRPAAVPRPADWPPMPAVRPARPAGSVGLTQELAAALGLPKHCTRAVLTLEVNKAPRLDVEILLSKGQHSFELDATGKAIKSIAFSYRLVPFGEPR